MTITAMGQTTKVLIMAGGTGGHVFPALTIARELLARGVEVEWLGTRHGLEARVIGNTSIPLHFISVGGLRGKNLLKKLLAPFAILRALVQALITVRRIRPACVLGMGGFVTGPGGLAARILGRKLLIHEQNAIAGLTNQLLYPFAHLVMEAFPGAFRRKQELGGTRLWGLLMSPDKIRVVGNPVRADILALAPGTQRIMVRQDVLHVLVLGGSLGAVALNRAIPAWLAARGMVTDLRIRHQCGERNQEQTQQFYQQAGVEIGNQVELVPFVQDMAEAYAWADIVVCRAGASTIAELAIVGLPSVLVPYPWAVDDHQTANAAILEQAGAAWILHDAELGTGALAAIMEPLVKDRTILLQKAQAATAVSMRDATSKAADLCMEAFHG
jgi:UDP-N-acetylglucosamine--N-acetylmuramyl-(pentapeptide) pyrophosphoryl-undecaprenol N-acetylglucosamine transferase